MEAAPRPCPRCRGVLLPAPGCTDEHGNPLLVLDCSEGCGEAVIVGPIETFASVPPTVARWEELVL